MDFLEEWQKRQVRPSSLPPFTIDHDKWDREDYEKLLKEIAQLNVAEGRITEKIRTGEALFADTYYALAKPEPDILPAKDVRPSHLINRAVMAEAMSLSEYEELRLSSSGDEIGSALACVVMEPELEIIWDKMETEKKLSQAMAQKQDQIDQNDLNAESLMKELEDLDPDDPENQQEAANYQEQLDALNRQTEALLASLSGEAQEMQDLLDQRMPGLRTEIKNALQKGIDEVQDMQAQSRSWGLAPGQLMRLSVKERLELAARLNNRRLREIAALIGPMKRLAFAEQMRKTTDARDEVYDLSLGNDLARVLPIELMAIHDPIRRLDFYRKWVEGKLLQYELRGLERVAKGGIILCEDGSGSMSGKPEMWAKAVSICLLNIAREQKRSFYGIHFGSVGQLACYDFRDPSDISLEKVLEWAEVFWAGGTDFMSPLSHSLDLLKEEHEQFGAVKGDIVFITDGMCGVTPQWLTEFKKEQERLNFRVFGVIIGGTKKDEPLNEICDGRVFTVKDLQSGEDVREIFRWV